MGLLSDIKRHFVTARAMEQGTHPFEGNIIIRTYKSFTELPDSYTLPETEAWIIGGKMYRNAGDAKVAATDEQRFLGNIWTI